MLKFNMIGTVPVYDSVIHYQRDLATLTAQDFVDVVRLHAEDGVDFVTLHCGITRKTIDQIKKHKRKMNIVSRGGSLVFAWMCMTGEENPFYEHYDEILEICEEHDVTISLGDACRPGCLADATDVCQIEELVRLGELTKRAWDHNVQVMVEGPGHVPLDQVAANMKVQQSICMGAPFYVLGPLVTDIAPGYDHITAAIGGAVAAMNGAAFLCYVTPAEHLALPNVEDTKQGIIASKIAAHAADIAKGIPGARDIDDKMADARRVLDWDAQFACALDPETAKAIRDDRLPEDDHSEACSMCGKFCAVRSMNKALAGGFHNDKQTANAIYDGDNYAENYHKDLLDANKNIIISSPAISGTKVYELINLLKEKQLSGVQITIVTWAPDSYGFGDASYWMQLHEEMRKAGFYIKTVEESCERFAVIDQEVVWYGNINLLAKDKVDDSIMRVLSKEIASELMEITFGDNG